jgi:hypothetical protein
VRGDGEGREEDRVRSGREEVREEGEENQTRWRKDIEINQ